MSTLKTISLLFIIVILLSTQIVASFTQDLDQEWTDEQRSDDTSSSFFDADSFFDEDVSLINEDMPIVSGRLSYINQSFMLSAEELHLQETVDAFDFILEDSIPCNQPGLPLVPMKTITISLPKNATIHSVSVHEPFLQKIMTPLHFQQTPTPQFWSIDETPLQQHTDEIVEKAVHEAEQKSMYPGKTHSYVVGKNATNTTVIIHLFPLHYRFDTKEAFLMHEATLSLSYTMTAEQEGAFFFNDDAVENIIITHPSFLTQAKRLQQFHNDQGVTTEVVTTRWIQSNFEPSSYPPIMGYKDFTSQERIRNYDDDLALRILSFLQHRSTDPHLQSITIFGNGIHVPPSYYFGYSYYPVPTDFYYSSPDLDFIQNYRIGRLPAHNILEATALVNKIIEWQPTDSQMDTVAIAGGIPFGSPFFIGELITIDSVNRGFLDGLHVDKYFRSDERFESTDILSALQDDYGMLYMICHGNANLIAVEEGRISPTDLAKMPKNTNAPILSCIACSSGSYDTHIIKQGYSLDKTSFGEGAVISKGGPIAYIGGSRTNDGYPLFTLNNGRVEISKETYMAGLLSYVNQAYRNASDYLGDLNFFAAGAYLEENDMDDFWNQYHYLDFILLGDPALRLPERELQEESYQQPVTSAQAPVDHIAYTSDEEYNGTINLHAIDEQTIYETQTQSPTILLKQIETGEYPDVEAHNSNHTTHNGTGTIRLIPPAGDLNLLRFETIDGKEDWMYYQAAWPVDDDYTPETPGFGTTRFDNIQEAIDHSRKQDHLYVFNGTYNESIVIDLPCSIQGEDKTTTIIDGNGDGDVISLLSDGVSIEGFTIRHSGDNLGDSGIDIQPKLSWKPSSIIIENNVIEENGNCGIFLSIPLKILSPTISILQNDILNNTYGIYVQKGDAEKEFIGNTISGNDYGMYLVDSKQDTIQANTVEDNAVGLFFKKVNRGKILSNNFIDNTQHCQFTKTTFTKFSANYWDNWIGIQSNKTILPPKIIDGRHEDNHRILAQFKIDFHALKEPFVMEATE